LISARDRRAPSMIEAWFNWSETMTSSRPRTAATVPEFAVNPDWNIRAASAPLNAANRRSSSSCRLMVPAMVRTAPEPAPSSVAALAAASRSLGWAARPR
jgi:hypothetical protein